MNQLGNLKMKLTFLFLVRSTFHLSWLFIVSIHNVLHLTIRSRNKKFCFQIDYQNYHLLA